MYTIKFSSAFKKSYKRMIKRGIDITLLDDVIENLRKGIKLDEKYHDHALVGNLKGFRECHIKPDWLLLYLIEDDVMTLTLVNTGTHTEVLTKK